MELQLFKEDIRKIILLRNILLLFGPSYRITDVLVRTNLPWHLVANLAFLGLV